mgnify:FL=1
MWGSENGAGLGVGGSEAGVGFWIGGLGLGVELDMRLFGV